MTQLALQLDPAPAVAEHEPPLEDGYDVYVAPLPGQPEPSGPLPVFAPCVQAAELIAAAAAQVPTDRCLALPARHWSDTLIEKLNEANRRADADLAFLEGLHAEILGCSVEEMRKRMVEEKSAQEAERRARLAQKTPRAPKGKAAKGGDAIGIGRAALSERQRDLLSLVRVENNLAVYTSEEQIPDWDLLKRIMLALGGTWKTGGKKAPGGFRFPDDLDAAELVRLAKETGEITDPKAAEFFWTSDELADELAAFIAPVATGRYLEPSAGKGALAHALRRACPDLVSSSIDCVEPLEENRRALREAGFFLIGHDFMAIEPPCSWDGVILNPPFSGQADCRHILRAIEFVKPGGRVAAIASVGIQDRQNKLAQQFRDELARHGAEVIANRDGSFEHAGTSARTCRILLTKRAS